MAHLHSLGVICDPSLGPLPAECGNLVPIDTSGQATPYEQAAAAAELSHLPIDPVTGQVAGAPGIQLTTAQIALLQAQNRNQALNQWIPGVSNAVILLLGGGIALLALAGGRR